MTNDLMTGPRSPRIGICFGSAFRNPHSAFRDPEDNRILECAVAGNADYVITGDSHLLKLNKYLNVDILNAAAFLEKL